MTMNRQRRSVGHFLGRDNPLKQYYVLMDSPSLAERLRSIDSMRATIAERRAGTNGNLVQAIQEKLRFLWTYHSNAIEGWFNSGG